MLWCHIVFDDKQVSGMVNAQTEHAKRFMFNTTNQVMRRMEQFRRVGINKSTQIKDMRLTLANQNNYNEQIPPELFDYYIDEYKNSGANHFSVSTLFFNPFKTFSFFSSIYF